MAAIVVLLSFGLLLGILRMQGALIMLCSLLLVTAAGSTFWSRRAIRSVSYERRFEPPRIFPGEETDYVVEITNHKLLPLPWLRINEHLPSSVVPLRGGPLVAGEEGWERHRTVSLGWHERLILRQRFTCARRGNYVIGPTDIETGDPMGFFPTELRIPESHALLVYPRVALLGPSAVISRFPFGATNARPPTLETLPDSRAYATTGLGTPCGGSIGRHLPVG